MEASNTADDARRHGDATSDEGHATPAPSRATTTSADSAGIAATPYAQAAHPNEGGDGEDPELIVNLKFIHHESVIVRCSPTVSIAELKRRVMEEEHARSDSSSGSTLRLIYKGKVLKDDQTLVSYGFQNGDTVHAVFGRPQNERPDLTPPAQTEPRVVRGEEGSSGNEGQTRARVLRYVNFVDAPHSGTPGIQNIAGSMFGFTPAATPSAGEGHRRPDANAGPSTNTRESVPPTENTQLVLDARNLQDQADAVRRLMPPLNLDPLSRPAGLSTDMYMAGNAMRRASDTFLGLHRQLALLSATILNENSLSAIERDRANRQIQLLGPALRQVSTMSMTLNGLLAGLSLGSNPTQDRAGTNATGRASSPAPPRASPPGVSFNNVRYESPAQGQEADQNTNRAAQVGNSVANILEAVSSLMGASNTPPPFAPQTPTIPTPPPGVNEFFSMLAGLASGGSNTSVNVNFGSHSNASTSTTYPATSSSSGSNQQPPPPFTQAQTRADSSMPATASSVSPPASFSIPARPFSTMLEAVRLERYIYHSFASH